MIMFTTLHQNAHFTSMTKLLQEPTARRCEERMHRITPAPIYKENITGTTNSSRVSTGIAMAALLPVYHTTYSGSHNGLLSIGYLGIKHYSTETAVQQTYAKYAMWK
jgi:hypothetical protein